MAKIISFKKIWEDAVSEHPEIEPCDYMEHDPLHSEREEWLLWDHEKTKWVRNNSAASYTDYTKSIYAAKRYTLTEGRLFVNLWSRNLREPYEIAPPMYSMINVNDIPLGLM